jgi:hypothetical protein
LRRDKPIGQWQELFERQSDAAFYHLLSYDAKNEVVTQPFFAPVGFGLNCQDSE